MVVVLVRYPFLDAETVSDQTPNLFTLTLYLPLLEVFVVPKVFEPCFTVIFADFVAVPVTVLDAVLSFDTFSTVYFVDFAMALGANTNGATITSSTISFLKMSFIIAPPKKYIQLFMSSVLDKNLR